MWSRYGLALVAGTLAVLLRYGLDPVLGDTSQYIVFYLAVVVAALLGGAGPGLLAVTVGAAAGTCLFKPNQGPLGLGGTEDIARLALFLLIGGITSVLAGRALAAQRTAEESRAIAEEASHAKDQFLAVLSHELRTPLTAVLPALEALSPHVSGEATEYLNMARRNVELEARLIDDLLDITRIAHGRIELRRQPVDVGAVLRHTIDVCYADLETHQARFGQHIEAPDLWITGDAVRLQQVFWNLLKNAVKFSPHGGCIGVRAWRQGDQILVQVTDSGIGLAPDALVRVFNAFEQINGPSARRFGGLGLGLAISKTLVELHGGTIHAESPGPGKGATFTVALPGLAMSPAPIEAPAPSCSASTPIQPRPAMRILLVEDHGDTARIMMRLLKLHGHDVQQAGDVATALQLAKTNRFDLLISDLGLPDGTGHDLLRRLRAQGSAVPAMALSGFGMATDVAMSRQVGFAEHLNKPVSFAVLEAAIARVTAQPSGAPSPGLSARSRPTTSATA